MKLNIVSVGEEIEKRKNPVMVVEFECINKYFGGLLCVIKIKTVALIDKESVTYEKLASIWEEGEEWYDEIRILKIECILQK